MRARGPVHGLVAGIFLFAVVSMAPGVTSGDTCNTYPQTGVAYYPGYGMVCSGLSAYSCTECYRRTPGGSVQSCAEAGEGNCFNPEYPHA